ncbi:cytochrome P450 [Amycolatopsis antarctica]|uniref:Cytochrome P450 n=1 Tax=Amycolatopsis antarctica TaxID=1854586 RepID=A0A263D6X0_9PSEU|nr:cytochrome P450 [Amycolatopsis antarctica]OZM74163.1 cytochrome P450 [Amycolatopsis antarctica]
MTVPKELPALETLWSPVLGDNPTLRAMLAEKPIWRVRTHTGEESWLVLGAAEIRELMLDRRLVRSHPSPTDASRLTDNPVFEMVASMGGDDPHTVHTQMRSLLIPFFTQKRMTALRPRIESIVHDAIDHVLGQPQPVDLLPTFVLPVPLRALCEVMGVPEEERESLGELLSRAYRDDEQSSGQTELFGHLIDLAAWKRQNPADDVISTVAAVADEDVMVATVMYMLFVAGHESVSSHIGTGIARLLTRPDLRSALVDDPGLLPGAVEELLRTATVGGAWQPHYAFEDLEVGGEHIRTGELVLLDFAMANHDPRQFADPRVVDFHRSPNQHLAFAHGAWHCVGAPLARMELATVYSALLSRMPTLSLAVSPDQLGDPEKLKERLSSSLAWLPVTW